MSEIASSEIDAQETVEVEKDNMQSFYELLSSIEQSSSDERDKGTRFENLVLDFLQNDPTYNNDFTKIQTYADWAQEHTDLVPNKKDIGIDLVATNLCLDNEPQTYTAIQCKFYAKDAKVPKKEIDSFIAASDKEFFTGRMMVATNSNWSDNAWATLAGNKCKPYLLDREKLAQSSIDWSQYLKTGQVNVTKRSLRSYQQTALQNVISGFKTHDRGKLIDLVPNKKDIGIDLVATNLCLDNEPQTYTAIQCKFYAKDAKVPKKEIDSFIAASDKEFFTGRMMVATNSNWSDNAWATLAGNKCKPYLLDREKLAQSSIDWSQYLKTGQVNVTKRSLRSYQQTALQNVISGFKTHDRGKLIMACSIDWSQYLKTGQVNVTKRSLRSYQQTALQNVISGFKTHDRGKLIMACGTGKTYTSLKIAEAQTNNNGFVLFLVPSLALLSQTLSDWKQQSEFPIRAFAVCSDTTVGKKTKSGSIDELLTPNELNYPATTNEQDLAKHVQNAFKYKEQNQEQGMVVIFSTYQSIEVIALAQNKLGMRPFDLVICDEAHRTAGGYLINPEGMVVIFSTYQSIEVIALAQNKLGMRPFDLVICDEAHRTAGGYLINPELTKKEILAQSGILKDADLSALNAEQTQAPTQATTEAEPNPAQEKDTKAKTKSRKSKLDFIDEEEAVFTRVHNDQYIHAKKRLYMTATPKIYGDALKSACI